MSDLLSLGLRPKTFSSMIGAEKLTNKIRKLYATGREPKAFMFVGPTGAGKTTLARILALSLQCVHQKQFGNPCKECRLNRSLFDIFEINCADVTGVDRVRATMAGMDNYPRPGSRRRVYILDEAHKMSDSAQNYMLKPFEECPQSTVWIICTTEPEKLLVTLRSRCMVYAVPTYGIEETKALVTKALKKLECDRDSFELVEALLNAGVSGPRGILNAVEKYASDSLSTAEDAARESSYADVDVRDLSRAIIKGSWRDAGRWLRGSNPNDARGIRAQIASYLGKILLEDENISESNDAVARAIYQLDRMVYAGDKSHRAVMAAIIYNLTQAMKEHPR